MPQTAINPNRGTDAQWGLGPNGDWGTMGTDAQWGLSPQVDSDA